MDERGNVVQLRDVVSYVGDELQRRVCSGMARHSPDRVSVDGRGVGIASLAGDGEGIEVTPKLEGGKARPRSVLKLARVHERSASGGNLMRARVDAVGAVLSWDVRRLNAR